MPSNGAHWIRAALQVNPYSYEGRNAPRTFFDSEDAYNTALLDECDAQGVSLIAVTDHWNVDSARGLLDAAEGRGITALPGFEANSSEGVHILVIFEALTDTAVINAAIGRCGATPGCANGTVGESYSLIMERMTQDGALAIPAHANVSPAGMLTTRSGQPLVAMIQNPHLHAIGITPTATPTQDQQAITEGRAPFAREHPLAIIHADDVMGPRQLRTAGASSWFKVSTPSLSSLKLAVRTPQTRVSLTNPATTPRSTIKSISWVGGYLDGVFLPISEDLTSLIGGRGAGKSTVIESLRYAFNMPALSSQMKADHRNIVSNVLRTGTIIRVEIEAVSPMRTTFTIQREVPNEPVVIDTNGHRTQLSPLDVIGQVEIFGQHELAELADDAASVAELVRRFNGAGGEDSSIGAARTALRENRLALVHAEQEKVTLETDVSQIGRLEEQVAHYEQTDVPTKLSGQQRLAQDKAIFEEAKERVSSVRTKLDRFTGDQSIPDLVVTLPNLLNAPQAVRLEKAAAALSELHTTVTRLVDEIRIAIESAANEVETAFGEWKTATAEEETQYGEVLRELHDLGLRPDKYVATKAQLATLQAAVPRLTAHDDKIARLQAERLSLLESLRGHETRRTETLQIAVRSANETTGGVVVVRPSASTVRSHIMDVVRSHVSGQRTQISAAVDAESFAPSALAAAIREGVTGLERHDIRGAQATNLAAAGEALARELEELSLDLDVEVLLRVEGASELRSMNQLSKGQKATALLLLLLGASDAPLIVDQPEDDLDNNFVYKGIVRNLRTLKGRRQVITSTHNANVPVLGDAELIIALESDGQHGKPAPEGVGSLDDRAIRALVENILEGGPAAFNARHHLYGF